MKRLAAVFVLFGLLLTCVACTAGQGGKKSDRLKVVTTIFPPYDFARQLGGDYVSVDMLIDPGTETHTYEPSPQDIIAVQSCDLFIYGGGESDTWVDQILSDLDANHVRVISMMDCVQALEEEVPQGMAENHSHENEEEAAYDEHVWTSMQNDVQICSEIADALVELDPDHADTYRANFDTYRGELESLDADFKAVVEQADRHTLVFGDRFPLRYFVETYGLSYYAAFPGCAESTEPNAATIANLIDVVREQQIPIILINELSTGQIAQAISEETGAKVETFYSCHTVSKDDFENEETFLSIMRRNVPVLKEALGVGSD